MDHVEIVPRQFSLAPYRFGTPQTSGVMTIVPVFGPDMEGRFAPPLSGMKLSMVRTYGQMELTNSSGLGVAIVPLHMGYIQDQAQNHALCRVSFIPGGSKKMFEDACCVQASQGGYLEGREQWFFVLPLQLREAALNLRGVSNYSKLWEEISKLNQTLGLESRGHLEQIVSKHRAFLTQYQSRFELQPGQTGALFFINGRLVGVELAPSAQFFQEMWMPLVCFCYGVAAMEHEKVKGLKALAPVMQPPGEPFEAASLPELRQRLSDSRRDWQEQVSEWMAAPPQDFTMLEEERYLNMRLLGVEGKDFVGQVVEEDGTLLYASLFARAKAMAVR